MVCDASRGLKSQQIALFHRTVWPDLKKCYEKGGLDLVTSKEVDWRRDRFQIIKKRGTRRSCQ